MIAKLKQFASRAAVTLGLGASLFGPASPPADAKVTPNRPNLGTLNNNWYQWGNQFCQYLENPDTIDVRTYELMLLTDECLASGIEFVTQAAVAKLGEYTHPNPDIEKLVRRVLVQMDGSWTENIGEILTALWAGFSVTEIIWQVEEDGTIGIDRLQTLHPSSIHFQLNTEGPKKNQIKSVHQWQFEANSVEIPVEKCIIYSRRKRFGNPYGQSCFRSAYKSWFLKDVMLKNWGITMERYGSPHAVATVEQGAGATVNVGGKEVDVFEYVSKQLEQLSAKGSMVAGEGTKVELFQAARSVGNDFEGLVAYCNKMMYRALGLPSLIADHGTGGGSYSLGQKHFDLFVLMLEKLLDDLIEQIIEQLVRRLIEYNFGKQESYGTFLVEEFQTDDLKTASEVVKNLVEAGVANPDDPAERAELRERVGLAAEGETSAPATEQPKPVEMSSSLRGRLRQRTSTRRGKPSPSLTPGRVVQELLSAA